MARHLKKKKASGAYTSDLEAPGNWGGIQNLVLGTKASQSAQEIRYLRIASINTDLLTGKLLDL